MGVQIPRRVHSQVPEEDAVWADKTASWGSVPQVGRAEGESDRGGAYAAGPRAYVDLDPTEIRGVASGRLYQGKKCDPHRAGVRRKETKFCRPKLLGSRVFRLHGGA